MGAGVEERMTRSLIHPSMLTRLRPHFFTDTGTVQETTESQNAIGGVTDSWSNLSGHVDIACSIAPLSAWERKDQEYSFSENISQVLLSGPYTGITTKHRFVANSINYDIISVEHDSHGTNTKLRVRVIAN